MVVLYNILCKLSDVGLYFGGGVVAFFIYMIIDSIKNHNMISLQYFSEEYFGNKKEGYVYIFLTGFIISFVSVIGSLLMSNSAYVDFSEKEKISYTVCKLVVVTFSMVLCIINIYSNQKSNTDNLNKS